MQFSNLLTVPACIINFDKLYSHDKGFHYMLKSHVIQQLHYLYVKEEISDEELSLII